MGGNDKETKLEPSDVKAVQDELDKEKARVEGTSLTPLDTVNSILYGLSDSGQALWKDVDKATKHVNDMLANLATGLTHYHDGLGNAARSITETSDHTKDDARLLNEGTNLIAKPFFEQRHNKDRTGDTPPPLIPWNKRRPEMI